MMLGDSMLYICRYVYMYMYMIYMYVYDVYDVCDVYVYDVICMYMI